MKLTLIQLFKLIFNKKLSNSLEFYADPSVLNYYLDEKLKPLDPYEENILSFVQNFDSILIIGGGTGREAFNLINQFKEIINHEPILKMWPSKNLTKIKWVQDLNELENAIFSNIWISSNVISFMNINERNRFIKKIHSILDRNGAVFVRPDIMPISFVRTFKYWCLSNILKWWIKMPAFQDGDTLRQSLESFSATIDSVKKEFIYYHYFPSENHFTREWKRLNFKVQKINSEFYMMKKNE